MDRFVAARGPAGALLQAQGVVRSANENLAAADLLEVAPQAQVGVAHLQHLGVDRAMRGMTDGAALTQRLVLEHERTALRGMAR